MHDERAAIQYAFRGNQFRRLLIERNVVANAQPILGRLDPRRSSVAHQPRAFEVDEIVLCPVAYVGVALPPVRDDTVARVGLESLPTGAGLPEQVPRLAA